MSNKIVPQTYRGVIDEVINSLRSDFEEFGVNEEVLAQLQSKWQAKVIASRAADFESFSNSQFREDKHSAPAPAHTPSSSRTSYRSTPPVPPMPPVQHRTPQQTHIQIKEEPRPHPVIPPPVRASPAQAAHFPSTTYGPINHALFQHMAHPGTHIPGPHPYSIPPLQADRQGVLMHNRGAPPAGGRYNMPQTDGASATPEDDFAEMLAGHGGAARRRMLARYPWMREARFGGDAAAAAQGELQIPQVDGPSGGGGSSIPPLSLNLTDITALSLPNGSKKEEAAQIPTLSMTLNLADIPPLQMPVHPSLKSPPPPPSAPLSRSSTVASTSTIKTEEGKSKPVPVANFARNPNLPAQANEDINSDLDDSDEEETEDPNGLPTDPDANVTYCTYDKVTRVKTKWKVVFRDGMIHANGKDYLFGRCTGEFDW